MPAAACRPRVEPRPALVPQDGPQRRRRRLARANGSAACEDFQKIDTDGDGLISVEEAEKADAWFRERQANTK